MIPSKGGNTLFASTYAAYDSLPLPLCERADRMQILFLYDYEKNANRKAATDWAGCGYRVKPK